MSETLASIRISMNGEARELPAGTTLATLIAATGVDIRKIAVERNREIVPRSTYFAATLEDGDALEIVHFIGGG